MSRGAEYKFIPTDPEDIIIWLTAIYEDHWSEDNMSSRINVLRSLNP